MAFTFTFGADTSVVDVGPAVATTNLMLSTSNALALAAHNATVQQQQAFAAAHAMTIEMIKNMRAAPAAPAAAPAPPWVFA